MIKKFLIDRLKEPTTWGGIISLVTLFGVNICPEMQKQIIAVGVAVGSLVVMVLQEGNNGASPQVAEPGNTTGVGNTSITQDDNLAANYDPNQP